MKLKCVKTSEIVAARCHILRLKCNIVDFGWVVVWNLQHCIAQTL